jgi:hypothetical protein
VAWERVASLLGLALLDLAMFGRYIRQLAISVTCEIRVAIFGPVRKVHCAC